MNAVQLEKKAEAALMFLHEKAGEHAEARAQADHMDDWCKVELARIKGLYVGASDAKATAEALTHPDYHKALEAARIARRMWYEAQFKREAAMAFVEAWRTACSNMRANV
jgi:hypothetical protein